MSTMMDLDILGGADRVKADLVGAVTRQRKRLELTVADVDRICRFGKHYTPPEQPQRAPHLEGKKRTNRVLPPWETIEANPALMRGDIFSVAATALDIPLIEAIGEEQLGKLESAWPDTQAVPLEVLFGGGFGELPTIPRENKLSVYLAMRVLGELT